MKNPMLRYLCFLILLLALTTPGSTHECHDSSDHSLFTNAQRVLTGNHVESMNSTLPSPQLYPHQWSWDSAFIAFGYSHYDVPRAMAEIRALFRGQWRNGLLPSIVFNPSATESYFPGPDFWRINTCEDAPKLAQTTGIVQPALHALAVLKIYQNAESKRSVLPFLKEMYPKLKAWHDYLYRERDPYNEGLVYIRHMWESGMDNSPAWQDSLNRMKISQEDIPEYRRVDAGKVQDAGERPTNFFYDRAVHLIKIFYENAYNEKAIFEQSPFLIQDVLFNSILARASEALAEIAEIISLPDEEVQAHHDASRKTAKAISEKLFNDEDGFFYDYDLVAKEPIRVKISGGFVSLFGAELTRDQLKKMIDVLLTDDFVGEDMSAWTIPSVSMNDPSYSNFSYWRGPVWMNINYLVREGLLRNSQFDPRADEVADYLKTKSLDLLRTHGFYEYFSPVDGSPHGGHSFSWSAALAMDWICSSSLESEEGYSGKANLSEYMLVTALAVLLGMIAFKSTLFVRQSEEKLKE